MKEKTSTTSNGLIWFGAGVSIAEILTGTFIAPLGFAKGMAAIVTGHIIGFLLMFFAGLIGAKTEKSSMETVKISFGNKGSLIFSVLNVIQLVGWTAVMILSGASSANAVFPAVGVQVWCGVIFLLILVWITIGAKSLEKINVVSMSALFILTLIMSVTVFKGGKTALSGDGITFGAAVELSVAMPLSWLPLISDYTRNAKKPFMATTISCVAYFAASVWMYAIGLGAAVFTGESDVSLVIAKAGLGVGALVIVIFSTVTTTFLDAYSAGVSMESISAKIKEKPAAVVVCITGVFLAVFASIVQFEEFLYFIGSVFAPMTAILITDYFVLKKDNSIKKADFTNIVIWICGFVLYRAMMRIDTPLGYTLPSMVVVGVLCIITEKIKRVVIKS